MTVLIRADASSALGSGHVVRCANLASRLRQSGRDVHFLCADLTDAAAAWLAGQGFETHPTPQDRTGDLAASVEIAQAFESVDLVIVDHYNLDRRWEEGMRTVSPRIMVIDDLADRLHDCDALLDPTPVAEGARRYSGLVPSHARLWTGPQYALLRKEFDGDVDRDRDGSIRRILAFLGGGITPSDLAPLIEALGSAASIGVEITLLLGYAFPSPREVIDAGRRSGINVVQATDDVVGLLRWGDLAVGACGGAAWERCATGLPTLAVITAENQLLNAAGLERHGAARYLGVLGDVTAEQWQRSLDDCLGNPDAMRSMSSAARSMTAGRREALLEVERSLTGGDFT